MSLQLGVRIRDIVKGEDAPAKLEEKVCAEGNETPERNLVDDER
jgi:hypothetical protein